MTFVGCRRGCSSLVVAACERRDQTPRQHHFADGFVLMGANCELSIAHSRLTNFGPHLGICNVYQRSAHRQASPTGTLCAEQCQAVTTNALHVHTQLSQSTRVCDCDLLQWPVTSVGLLTLRQAHRKHCQLCHGYQSCKGGDNMLCLDCAAEPVTRRRLQSHVNTPMQSNTHLDLLHDVKALHNLQCK